MAKVFTEHFMGLAERLADKTVGQFDPTVLKALVDKPKVCDSKLAFPPITPSQTHQLIKAIPSCKATGLDGVSTRLEQGWCTSGESTYLPPMWPGFKSRRRHHMWVEFVFGSLPCSERFFSGYSDFPLSSKTNISKFQFDQESGRWRTTMWMCYLQIVIHLCYNQRQNEFTHFTLKGLFGISLTSQGQNIAFPPPSPPYNVVPLFELP